MFWGEVIKGKAWAPWIGASSQKGTPRERKQRLPGFFQLFLLEAEVYVIVASDRYPQSKHSEGDIYSVANSSNHASGSFSTVPNTGRSPEGEEC